MGYFFHGWRRTMGMVTLVMALLLMGGWVRSLSVEDDWGVTFFGRYSVWLLSVNGSFGCTIVDERPERFWWASAPLTPPLIDSQGYVVTPNGVRLGGRMMDPSSDEIDPHPRVRLVQPDGLPGFVHYWSVITPLTLLSVYLLLIQPDAMLKRLGDYLARWRRQAGVVTMLCTLLFTGWWIRSLVVRDCIFVQDFVKSDFAKYLVVPIVDRSLAGLATERHSLICLTYDDHQKITLAPSLYPAVSFPSRASPSKEVVHVNFEHDVSTEALPILSTTVIPIQLDVMPFMTIPFWSIVIPLALLSAYLLLGKRPIEKPAAIHER